MADPSPADPAPPPAPSTSWHIDVPADILGTWQNKNYDLSDPKNVAIEATKAYREAQRFVGTPPDRLIKLPEKPDDAAGWDAVWQRLGAPKAATEYDFSGIKYGDAELEPSFVDTMRATFAKAHLPKDAAADVTKAVVKYLESADAEEATARAAALQSEQDKLAQSWGKNANFNMLTAQQGARRLGLNLDPQTGNPEDKAAVALIEKTFGYARVMELFRKIGAGTSEDTFVSGGVPGGTPVTQEGAQARLSELSADKDWSARLLKGDVAARREFDNLTQLIAGVAA